MVDSVIEPIKAQMKPKRYLPQNLTKELKTLAAGIVEKKENRWQDRDKKVREVAGMCMAQVVDVDEFAENFYRHIGRVFAEQVTDLRSNIVRSACACIVILSEELGDAFDRAFCTLFVSGLVKQTAVKALPIKLSAYECMMTVMSHRTIPPMIQPLVRESQHKEKIIRQRVAEFLSYICDNWDTTMLQKQVGLILGTIELRLEEADETVRQHSRNAIVSLSHTFPNAILTFLQGIDPRVIKLMEAELNPEVLDGIGSGLDGGMTTSVRGSSSAYGNTLAAPGPNSRATRRSTGGIANKSYTSRSSQGRARAITTDQSQALSPNRRSTTRNNTPASARSTGSGRSSGGSRSGASPARKSGGAQRAREIFAMSNVDDDYDNGRPTMRKAKSEQTFESTQNAAPTAPTAPGDLLARLQQLRNEVLEIQESGR